MTQLGSIGPSDSAVTEASRSMAGDEGEAPMAPGPGGYPVIGVLPQVRRKRLDFLLTTALDYGPVAAFSLGPLRLFLVTHPELIRQVLESRAFEKDTRYRIFRVLLGEGLLLSEGERWRRKRKILQPAFNRQRMASIAQGIVDETRAACRRLEVGPLRSRSTDVGRAMMDLTHRIAVRTLFGTDLGADTDLLLRGTEVVNDYVNRHAWALVQIPLAIPTPSNRRIREAGRGMAAVIDEILEVRGCDYARAGDVLSMLMSARDEDTGERLDEKELRDEIMTFLLIGPGSTASCLTFTWYLLSRYPAVRETIEDEVDRTLEGRDATFEDLPALAYTRMVIEESLRLYPPVYVFSRTPREDTAIGEYTVRRGSTVLLSPWVMHHHPAYWENPEGFDPRRFEPSRCSSRPRYAYFPFGGGPRICIGERLAIMEAQIIVATVSQKLRLDLAPGGTIDPNPQLTLRPRLPMTLHRRADSREAPA